MPEARNATLVLVHGAGGGAWSWERLGKELDARGVDHVEIDLPTMDENGDPMADFHTDAACVRSVVDRVDGPVVLCGNSYGGIVITEASVGHPHIKRLVYLAAFMPDADEEVVSVLMTNCTPEFVAGLTLSPDGRGGMDPEAAKNVSFDQASPEVADWATSQIRTMAMGSGGSPTVTGVGWREIPSTYVVSTEDRSLQVDTQRRWARERASECVEVPFDHCPQISHPAEVAEILAQLTLGAP